MTIELADNIELLVNGEPYRGPAILSGEVELSTDGIPQRIVLDMDVTGERLRRAATAAFPGMSTEEIIESLSVRSIS